MHFSMGPRIRSVNLSRGLPACRFFRLVVSCQAPRPARQQQDVLRHRRGVLVGGGLAVLAGCAPVQPTLARGLDAYLRKKPLDPLDTYVAPLIAAKDELKSSLSVSDTDVSEARNMLRSGALSGFRINARAVGEYSKRLETSTDPQKLVDKAIGTLENYDSALLLQSREQTPPKEPKELLTESLSAIDALLSTVPKDVMEDVTGE